MKAIIDKEFIQFLQDLHENLTTMGLKPTYLRLDNESSSALENLLK